jgi:hypothetical protein
VNEGDGGTQPPLPPRPPLPPLHISEGTQFWATTTQFMTTMMVTMPRAMICLVARQTTSSNTTHPCLM